MNLKTFILTITLIHVSMQLFGQEDRTGAKFIDTCKVQVILSDTVFKKLMVDSNNQFTVSCNCKLLKYMLSIYDRWGNVAFSSNDINNKVNLSEIKNGIYVWFVEVKYPNGKKEKRKGTIKIQ